MWFGPILHCLYKWWTFWSLPPDPFADASKGDAVDHVHIRIQQRNGRKSLTTVQGISDKYDKKKLVRAFKRVCWLNIELFSLSNVMLSKKLKKKLFTGICL